MFRFTDEKREYTRYPIDFECIVIDAKQKEIPCRIEDISENGARLSICELNVGDEVELAFMDDSEFFINVYAPAFITGRGRVVRLTEHGVGIALHKSYELTEYINNRQAAVYVERIRTDREKREEGE